MHVFIKKSNSLITLSNIFKNTKYIILNKFNMISSDDKENKRIAKGTEHSIQHQRVNITKEFVKTTSPQFLAEREKKWEEFYAKQQEYFKSLPREKINLKLKDGKCVEGVSFETTPLDIAKKNLKKSLIGDLIVAKVK